MTITFTTWGEDEPAAILGFAIYELEMLPEYKTRDNCNIKTRRFGVQYEDPCGVMSDLGVTTYAAWGDKFIEFAKHTGQNVIVQPINWYSGPMFDCKCQPGGLWYWATLADHTQYSLSSSKPNEWIIPFLDKCENAGIDFIGGMTLLRLGNLLKNMNIDLNSIYDGKDTYNNMRADNKVQASCNDWTTVYNPLNRENLVAKGIENVDLDHLDDDFDDFAYGEKPDDFGGAPIFNPIHPEVRRALVEYFEEISERYGSKKAFKGVSINVWHGTFIWYSSLLLGYDDYTIKLFESETGIKVPCNPTDHERFLKRYEYLIQRNRDVWINWRCNKIHSLVLEIRNALQKYNPELKLYLCIWNEPVKKTMFGFFNESANYPAFITERDFLKEGGIDLSLFENDEGICVSVEQNQHRDRGWTTEGVNLPVEQTRFFHDLAYMDESWIDDEKKLKQNGAFVFDSWTEGWGVNTIHKFDEHTPEIDKVLEAQDLENVHFNKRTCKLPPDGYWFESQRQITSCYPAGRNYLEPFAYAMAELAPMYLLRGGLYLDQSHVEEIRSYTSEFTVLPEVKFDDVDGKMDPVVVRELNYNGRYYFYVVNKEPYPVKIKIDFEATGEFEKNGNMLENVLEPFALKTYICNGNNKIIAYEDDADVTVYKSRYDEQIGIFDYLLENNIRIYGDKLIRDKLETSYSAGECARVRHILNCYVCKKAKSIIKGECKK